MGKKRKFQQSGNAEHVSGEKRSFVFLGGNLGLDLVNTEVMVRGKRTDLLQTPQDASQWWEMARQAHPDLSQEGEQVRWDEHQLRALHALRTILRNLFEDIAARCRVDNMAVRELNAFLREGYYELEVSPEGALSAIYRTRQDRRASAVVTIAFAAFRLLTEHDLRRLRICRNDRCILLFYDTTRSATRHWCSVACANRARSIQNYRRAKGK
ncbi:CGNR zinc finger domain-containing protein [Thermogemmatispora onikobensis]|uniref:CGNR zinc finger domain-containing protein n=1 Tax=Thermogemmatispora onikobensis TaxID=732234 RepID=UPI00085332F2|nr:ABATE domain-containing protein [Thermogemmatispora onikobensis]